MQNTDRDWRSFALLLIDVQNDFWLEKLAKQFPHFLDQLAAQRAAWIEMLHLLSNTANR